MLSVSASDKAMFILFQNLEKVSGIGRKIHAQVDAMNSIGVHTTVSYLSKNGNEGHLLRMICDKEYSNHESICSFPINCTWRVSFSHLRSYLINNRYTIVYIRYTHFANPFFIGFLRKIKRAGIRVILEIPTYPYDHEYINRSLAEKLILAIERVSRERFKSCVDRVVTFSSEDSIYGVETIKINNGVDLNYIKESKINQVKCCVSIIAVASMYFWHGYDRLLAGLKNYYQNPVETSVWLYLVGIGNNSESQRYLTLIKSYGLSKYVHVRGFTSGDELNSIYEKCHIAAGCLGVHRKMIKDLKSLKNSEYCARGIPFFYSEHDVNFNDKPFVLKVPADDSDIDIARVVDFVKNTQIDRDAMKEFTRNHLGWETQMRKIFILKS